jgi:hypothetical protein
MPSPFIDINDISFWAKDGFIEAIQLCIINEIESSFLNLDPWVDEFKPELVL